MRRGARAALLSLVTWACATNPPSSELPAVPDVTTRVLDDTRIHVVNTGWVRVKQAHRALSGPESTRMLAILLDRDHTEWMPVLVGVIEHPDGVFLVDTGLDERLLAVDELTDDPGNAFVYGNLLHFQTPSGGRIDRRLAELGIDVSRLRGVVLTHQHGDHTAGLAHLPVDVPVYVGAADREGHTGSIAALVPTDRALRTLGSDAPAADPFVAGHALTRDGVVEIVGLPGHTPGHLGVRVRGRDGDVLFVGDAAFDRGQIEQGAIAGIVEQPEPARETLRRIATQLAARPTKLVLAHDPVTLAELARPW